MTPVSLEPAAPRSQDGPGLCFCQFGVRRKNGYNPGSAGSDFGERTGLTLVRQVRSSEKGQFLSSNSKPWQVRSSEEELG